MALPICNNLTMTGIRRTSSSDTLRVVVEAYQNFAEGEIDRVEFSISVNGVYNTTITVTTRAMWLHNDTTYDDPLPGNWGGGPSPSWAFGTEITMADYAAGYIEVVPTVYNPGGESVTLPTITIYNDKDGTDRRPTNAVIYWDWNSGSDSNTGLTTSDPVKTFQKACQVGASGTDCGGLTILINSAGTHHLQSSNSYSYGANLYTSGHHWIQVKAKPGLNREDVILKTASTFDGDWMTFAGNSTNQTVRIKFTDITIQSPGVVISTGTNVTGYTWLEHVLFEPPSPFNSSPNGFGMYIQVYDYASMPISLNAVGTYGRRHSTGVTANYAVTPRLGEFLRGCYINNMIGQAMHLAKTNEHFNNVLVRRLFGNFGISGYFEYLTGNFKLEADPGGTNYYRVVATSAYDGADIAENAVYMSGSILLGYKFDGFTNAANNHTWPVISGGYIGGLPYVTVSGSTMVPESTTVVGIQPAKRSTDEPWETLVHSDIVQFVSDDVHNIIVSSVAVFEGYQTQGVYSRTHDLSGVAIVNFYDGFAGTEYGLATRTYLVDGTTEHILFRDSTFAQLEVDSTEVNTDSEMNNCACSGFGAFAGSTAAYASVIPVDHMHFMQPAQAVGTNYTTGPFFESATPGLSDNAVASSSSTAYGTASTDWERPTAWFRSNKGAWDNVALADWSYSPDSNVEITAGLLSGQSRLPTLSVSSSLSTTLLSGSPNLLSGSLDREVTTNYLSGSALLPTHTSLISIQSSLLSGSPNLLEVTVIATPTELGSEAIYVGNNEDVAAASVIILGDDDVQTIELENPSISVNVTLQATASVDSEEIGVFNPAIAEVTAIRAPNLPNVTLEQPSYSLVSQGFTHVLVAAAEISDNELKPLLHEISNNNNNIGKVSASTKAIWVQNILEAEDKKNTNKNIISVLTHNYKKFDKKDRIAGRSVVSKHRL